MSNLEGIPIEPSGGESLPLRPGPVPEPPVVAPEPSPAPLPPAAPEPKEPDTGAVSGLENLALILLILGLILLATSLTDFFNWIIRNTIGRLGGGSRTPQLNAQAVTQALGGYLGKTAQKLDPEMGTSFTQMGHTVGLASRAYVAIGSRILKLATKVSVLEGAVSGDQVARSALRHQVQTQGATLQQTQKQTAAQLRAQHATDASLQTRLDEVTRHVTDVIEPELATLRHLIPDLQRGTADLWKLGQKHEEALGITAMVGTVAVAMGRLGAGWTRCETNQTIGKELCGSNGDTIKKLLKGSLDLLGVVEVCAMVGLLAKAVDNPLIIDSLGIFSVGIEDLLKCSGATRSDPLHTPRAVLAPPTAWAALAPVTL